MYYQITCKDMHNLLNIFFLFGRRARDSKFFCFCCVLIFKCAVIYETAQQWKSRKYMMSDMKLTATYLSTAFAMASLAALVKTTVPFGSKGS